MYHLTIIDDKQEVLELYNNLLSDHFRLKLVNNPFEFFEFIKTTPTDMVVINVNMPQINGLDLLKQLQFTNPKIPAIFLTGDPSEELLLKGLSLGAVDYIIKPISLKELIARIQNKIIASEVQSQKESTINMDNFTLYCDMQCAEINESKVQLTPIEFKFLHLLARNPNKIYSREYISKMLWPDVHVQNQNIDTHLSNLRKKLVPFSQNIKTIKSRGYILRV